MEFNEEFTYNEIDVLKSKNFHKNNMLLIIYHYCYCYAWKKKIHFSPNLEIRITLSNIFSAIYNWFIYSRIISVKTHRMADSSARSLSISNIMNYIMIYKDKKIFNIFFSVICRKKWHNFHSSYQISPPFFFQTKDVT